MLTAGLGVGVAELRDAQLTAQHEGPGVSGLGLLSTSNWASFTRKSTFLETVCANHCL